ncbi:MAG: 50S ribosomal protein L21 [Candidatus Porifericomitaceae bacterium WSBS_2022_MAG_OTU9]
MSVDICADKALALGNNTVGYAPGVASGLQHGAAACKIGGFSLRGFSALYAIIDNCNRQYTVKQGDRLRVEKLTTAEGELLNIAKVRLLVDGSDVQIGQPFVAGASVDARVVMHGRGPKIRIIKMKRRKHHRKTQGHRQSFSEIEIEAINVA